MPFRNQEISFETNDKIYLFSDGYADQLGETSGLKYMSKNFKALLAEISTLPMEAQKLQLEEKFDAWKGNKDQVDDVLVIGINLNRKAKVRKQPDKLSWENQRILIAEDTDINYFLLVEALRPTNVQIIRANNGREAVDFCRTNEVDLVLMDINMPMMNGIDATRNIREFRKDIPIIAQTAQSEYGDQERCLSAGCNDFISKPIDLRSFLETIQKHLFRI